MDTQRLSTELDLGPKPWLQRQLTAEHLAETLTGRHAREHWKYTPIGAFVDAYLDHHTQATPAATVEFHGANQPGVRITALTDLPTESLARVREALAHLDPQRYPLAEITALNVASGQLINIAESLEEPIRIRHLGGEALVLIDVAENVSAPIIETSDEPHFGNTLTLLNLGAGARLSHAHSALAAAPMHWSLRSARLAANASYELQQYLVGGQKRRSDCHIALAGPGATAAVTGAFVTEDGQHLDQQLVVEHLAPHTASTQTIHGIGMGKSRSVFNGRIHIHPGASGADAQLRNKNLSLNPGADINTKPELEIYTDDVKCAHGATVGQLDPEALFYLRSRGVPDAQARSLLSSAFIRSCITGLLAEPATRRLTECLA
mgnify:CR=1 FL=1